MRKNVKAATSLLCAAAMAMTIGSTAFAEETRTLRVAMECGYAPYNWTQSMTPMARYPLQTAQSTHMDTMS